MELLHYMHLLENFKEFVLLFIGGSTGNTTGDGGWFYEQ